MPEVGGGGDDEPMKKARRIWNEVLQQFKRGYKIKLRSNLSPAQLKVLNDLKVDDLIIICPADNVKAVVVEVRGTYLSKLRNQIHEGNYELTKNMKGQF